MQSAPFLAQVPAKYLTDPEEREFWDYAIRFFGSIQLDTSKNETDLTNTTSVIDVFGGTVVERIDVGNDESTQIEQSTTFNARSIAASGEAVNQEFVLASNGSTVTLMSNPPTNAIIKVGNADGSTINIQGNGRTINGSTSAQMTRQYAVFDFYYFIDTDEWVIA